MNKYKRGLILTAAGIGAIAASLAIRAPVTPEDAKILPPLEILAGSSDIKSALGYFKGQNVQLSAKPSSINYYGDYRLKIDLTVGRYSFKAATADYASFWEQLTAVRRVNRIDKKKVRDLYETLIERRQEGTLEHLTMAGYFNGDVFCIYSVSLNREKKNFYLLAYPKTEPLR